MVSQIDAIMGRDQTLPQRRRLLAAKSKVKAASAPRSARPSSKPAPLVAQAAAASLQSLPRIEIDISLAAEIDLAPLLHAVTRPPEPDGRWWGLRERFTHLGFAQGFDELLCLPHLIGVEPFRHQIETVRKVLKQFRGRVLLADEVGLGKTIEAGMVLKEYALRGMAERVLVLAPASLVGQWQEELQTKFGLSFATTHDQTLRHDPRAFWGQKRIVASISEARRREHSEHLLGNAFDLVIIDEAHHLRDRSSQSWKLVDALNKRFLLLLSATPVQNNLVELYNLMTLLKPGIFKTIEEFRAAYMTPGKPRQPANAERLRELMRTRCLLLAFRDTAVSDEKREGLVWIGLNQGTGAVIDGVLARLRPLLADTDWRVPDPDVRHAAGPMWDTSVLEARTGPLLQHRVQLEIAPFLRTMRRRLDRDRNRIHEYHNDLYVVAQKKLAATAGISGEKAAGGRKREMLRLAAIEREYSAKLDDLRRNYALRINIEWAQGLELFVPVQRFEVLIKRRKGERRMRIDWHPKVRLMEPPPSDWGLGLERSRLVCDDSLHVTDADGQSACRSCGRAFCRACHPTACPRCGQAIR